MTCQSWIKSEIRIAVSSVYDFEEEAGSPQSATRTCLCFFVFVIFMVGMLAVIIMG
ncbi:MAG: hypothetical protein ACFFER_01675 [Candidatus Thorarchaeota archaeon]